MSCRRSAVEGFADEFAYRFLPILSVFDDEIEYLERARCFTTDAFMGVPIRTTSLFKIGLFFALLAADDGGKWVVALGVRIERDER